jgi:tetratricopeptide (TPR) repeat protein
MKIDILHSSLLVNMKKDGSRRSSVEAHMARKRASEKLRIGRFTFGHSFISVFTFTFISLCMLPLIGCDSQQAGITGVDRGRNIPLDAKKAEVLKVLDRKFENPQAHFELGQIYQTEGLTQKAEYHYNVALSFDPSHVQAQAAMVKLFLNSSNPAKGKTYADLYVTQSGSEVQLLRLAKAFQAEQLDEYALTCYQQALRVAPESAEVSKQLGFFYLARNDKARAKEYLVRSFQLDPRQPEVANELGRLGVEVRIPQTPEEERIAATEPSEQDKDKEWRIVAKHGLIQMEPIVQKGEKKNK